MMKTYARNVLMGFLLTAAGLLPTAADAQLHEVRQTVYGMDCAPCAYAQENRLKALEGVQQATVSLNEGVATLSQEHGRWILTTPAQERYRRAEPGEITSASGDAVTVTGTVSSGEKPDSGWALQVTTIETQA